MADSRYETNPFRGPTRAGFGPAPPPKATISLRSRDDSNERRKPLILRQRRPAVCQAVVASDQFGFIYDRRLRRRQRNIRSLGGAGVSSLD